MKDRKVSFTLDGDVWPFSCFDSSTWSRNFSFSLSKVAIRLSLATILAFTIAASMSDSLIPSSPLSTAVIMWLWYPPGAESALSGFLIDSRASFVLLVKFFKSWRKYLTSLYHIISIGINTTTSPTDTSLRTFEASGPSHDLPVVFHSLTIASSLVSLGQQISMSRWTRPHLFYTTKVTYNVGSRSMLHSYIEGDNVAIR